MKYLCLLLLFHAHETLAFTSLSKDQILDRFDIPEKYQKYYARHFRDQTYKQFPDPKELAAIPLSLDEPLKIRGTSIHLGAVPGAYRYDVTMEDGIAIIEVRMHFKNATPEDLQKLANYLRAAAGDWSGPHPKYGFAYKFRFLVVENAADAHFSVNLTDKSAGPYFSTWSRSWSINQITHEMGHTMGLVDEYDLLPTHIDFQFGKSPSLTQVACETGSIMCNFNRPQAIHYYIILRRIILEAQKIK